MRIEEINIVNYGPLENFHLSCDNINLIYGRNETGKTALIDAITFALFRKKSIFPGQERFEEDFFREKGNIVLTVRHRDREYTFPGNFKFERIINLPHYHLASLFIIRAGDLSLREEEEWQDKIKEFLLGVPVNIAKIWEKIGEEVGLTPAGEWSDRKPFYRKSKINEKEKKSKNLLEAIERLEKIRQKERELEEKVKERNNLLQKRSRIILLKSYIKIEKVKKAYREWLNCKNLLLDYERYDEESYKEWVKREREYESLSNLKQNYEEDIQGIRREIEELSKREDDFKRERTELVSRKDRIDGLFILEEAKKILGLEKNTEEVKPKVTYYFISGSSLVLGGLFFFFFKAMENLKMLYIFLSLIIFTGGVFFLVFSYLYKMREVELKRKKDALLSEAKKIWPGIIEVKDVIERSESVDFSISQITDRLAYILEERKKKLLKLKEKKEGFNDVNRKLREVEEKIRELCNKTGLSTSDKLGEKLREKQSLKLKMESKAQVLKDLLGTDDFLEWERQALKEVKRPDISEEELKNEEKIEGIILKLDREIRDLDSEITSFTYGELGKLGVEDVTDIWRQLKEIEEELESFYFDKKAALLAKDILFQVSREMEKVLDKTICDEESGASFFFKEITSGYYKRLLWKDGKIYALSKDGKIYPRDVLSSGTKDQILFSLRLGLLKRGFPEGTFILLDDAFLTSDTARRRKQIEICRQLVKQEWQIFYFTVDEQLRDLFSSICDVKPVILG
ncbi:AAA family ATPase [Candidatus Aerophobetes bacterium]|nr:AAA family ATPase [Candidatus Aerophobetes bacterium]